MPEIERLKPPEKLYQQALVDLPENPTSEDISKAFDDNERSFVAWASKPIMDRDDEIIEADAWDVTNFDLNPVIIWSHDYWQPAVGQSLWVRPMRTGMKFKPAFADSDFGRELYSLYKQRVLRAFSVGFKPLEWHFGDKPDEPWLTYTEVELLEISCVNVPACPAALVELMAKGKIHTKQLQEAVKWSMDKSGLYEPTKTVIDMGKTSKDDTDDLKLLEDRIDRLEKRQIPPEMEDVINLKELSREELEALMATLQTIHDNLYPNSEPAPDDKDHEGADADSVDAPAEISDDDLAVLADSFAEATDDIDTPAEPINDEELNALLDTLTTEPEPDGDDGKGYTYEIHKRLQRGEVI